MVILLQMSTMKSIKLTNIWYISVRNNLYELNTKKALMGNQGLVQISMAGLPLLKYSFLLWLYDICYSIFRTFYDIFQCFLWHFMTKEYDKIVMFYNTIKLKFKLKGSLVRKTKVTLDENEKKFNSTQFNWQF